MKDEILKIKSEHPEYGYRKIAQILNIPWGQVRYYLSETFRTNGLKRKTLSKRRAVDRLKQAFGGKCSRCPYSKSLAALQFHHLDPKNKVGDVATIVRQRSYEEAYLEASKCVLICANCHAELHDVTS